MGKRFGTELVCVSTGITRDDYQRLLAIAERWGLLHRRSGRANEAAALRQVVALGLEVAEARAAGEVGRPQR